MGYFVIARHQFLLIPYNLFIHALLILSNSILWWLTMTKCLYDYDAMELIHNKDIVLMRLRTLEINLMKKESEILLNTDFKELKVTNEKQRTAYVNSQTVDLKEQIKAHKHSLEIVNDLLKLRMKEKGANQWNTLHRISV